LKKKEIVEYDKTTIRMTDLCFPLGRPGEAWMKSLQNYVLGAKNAIKVVVTW
jgi:hypothetical protein